MGKSKTGLVIYESYYLALKELPSEDRAVFLDGMFLYAFEKKEPDFSGHLKALWYAIKPTIDSAQKRYRANRSNGNKGGRPSKTEGKPKNNPNITQEEADSNQEKNIEKDIKIDTEKKTDIKNQSEADARLQGYVDSVRRSEKWIG